MKKRMFAAAAMALIASTALVGCGGNGDGTGSVAGGSTSDPASVSGEVKITGSTSVQPVMEALRDEFNKTYPNIRIEVGGGGSGVGVSDAQKGIVDLGMASRDLKKSETGIIAEKIATDGIALIVNKECTVDNVTSDQIYDLYTSGTAIGPITIPVTRESGSGTRSAFYELVRHSAKGALEDSEVWAPNLPTQTSTGAVVTLISTAGNINYIGYISLGSVNEEVVKKVKYNGVEATVANIEGGTYSLARPFHILLTEGKALSAAAQLFHDFIFSEAGQDVLEAEGCIRVSQ